MKFVWIVALLVCVCVSLRVFAQTSCSDATDNWSFQCVQADKTKPFCTLEDPGQGAPTQVRRCTQCRPGNNCDCPIGQYCSVQPGSTRGTCLNFAAFGRSCLPYDAPRIINNTFSSDDKCADLYPNNQTTTVSEVNFLGTCYDGVCRFCNPGLSSASGDQSCNPGDGIGPARVCVYPGVVVSAFSAPWNGNIYYTDRVAVWLAVFFPFLVICTISLAIIALASFRDKS